MAATEERSVPGRLWQQLKKPPEAFFGPTKAWGKLPEHRAQFFFECENASSDESCQQHFARARRNRRKGATDNIFGRTPARLPIASRRDRPDFPSCDREVAAGYRQFRSRY